MLRIFGRTVAAAIAASIFAAGASAQEAVRVGSKIDTEGALLGHMIVELLEANGIKTANKLQLGPTKIVRSAIVAGEIDLYPEYTGNGAFFFSVDTDPAWKNSKSGYEKVRAAVLEKHPGIKRALEPVFASLDLTTLQTLNAKIAVEGQDAKQVAIGYLRQKGFL